MRWARLQWLKSAEAGVWRKVLRQTPLLHASAAGGVFHGMRNLEGCSTLTTK